MRENTRRTKPKSVRFNRKSLNTLQHWTDTNNQVCLDLFSLQDTRLCLLFRHHTVMPLYKMMYGHKTLHSLASSVFKPCMYRCDCAMGSSNWCLREDPQTTPSLKAGSKIILSLVRLTTVLYYEGTKMQPS